MPTGMNHPESRDAAESSDGSNAHLNSAHTSGPVIQLTFHGDYEHKPIGIFTGSRCIFRKRSRRNVTGSQQLEP